MILPKKHIKLSESLFALGAVILSELDKPKSVDEIWLKVKESKVVKVNNFDNLILTLDYLYLLSFVRLDDEGSIVKCT